MRDGLQQMQWKKEEEIEMYCKAEEQTEQQQG